MSRDWLRVGLIFSATCGVIFLGRNCASSDDLPEGIREQPRVDKELSKKLGGTERYLTMVSTDKPIYHPGEKVYARGVLLNAANHKPLPNGYDNGTVQIKGPKGDIVASGTAQVQDSVWGFAWPVPEGQAGGEYTVKVIYPWSGHAPAERKFDVRDYRAPRLKSQITFMRDGYAPGDKVSATLDVKRAEGGVPEGARVTVTARVDGVEVSGGTARVDAKGLCSVNFDLPREIPRGEGTLALVIEDGGVVETASKTIPILLQTVDLQMFPEGGELIGGYKSRVYLQARQPNGKPADLVGKIMKKDVIPTAVAEFKTEHEGRGRFEFVPEPGKEYYLAVSEPAGIKTTFPLPQAKAAGATLHADKDVFGKGQPITMQVGCTENVFHVSLRKKDAELDLLKFDLTKRDRGVKPGTLLPVAFNVPEDVDGVLTATVWNDNGEPLAERLVFRQAAHPLKITITPEKKSYVPGDKATLKVKATDDTGKPVSAVVGLTVTDDSVLEMVEKREQAPRLPVMLYLEPEVKDLADAHVYMDESNPKAGIATDLLLGTQGWRHFEMLDIAKFIEKYGDEGRRALALRIQSEVEKQKADQLAMAEQEGAGAGDLAMFARRRGANRQLVEIEFGAPAQNAMPMPKAAAMPVPPAAPHAMAPAANPRKMDKAVWFNAPRQVQIIDERPVIQDFRQAAAGGMAGAPVGKLMAAPANAGADSDELQIALKNVAANEKKRMFAKEEIAADLSSMVVVREFAHEVRPNRKSGDRVDFEETLFWNAGVKTDPNTGEASISFGLNDSVSTFRVLADAFSGSGSVGTANVGVESVQPFYAEAKLPLEVTAGDQVLLPVSLVNSTASEMPGTDAKINLTGEFKLLPIAKGAGDIGAGERIRWIQPIEVGAGNGLKDFTLIAKSGEFEDKVTRKLSVKPKGFPIEVAFGGMLEPGKSVTHNITIPGSVVASSMTSNSAVYPTPLANLSEALARLIQDPYGCFEQTSSTSYPLTMAQQYFVSHSGVDPKLVETSKAKLDDGYKKLVGFWCPDRGYEWFGENPGHEALTAFGLLHFVDMSKVREVDQNMVSSTRAWLLKQKDGKGGFTRKRRSLHTWTEDKDCSSAYILWALLETGQPAADLKPELEAIKQAASSTSNNYTVALAANALYLAGEKADAKKLMDKLAAKQKADGSVDGMTCSIVGSGGEALQIEGASLATLAWLRDPSYAGNVEKSIKFLADSCKAGRYGSTQSTVLALRAIVTYDKQRARPKAPGKVRLFVDGQSIGDWAAFDQKTEGAIKLPDLSELLTPGDHKLELRMEGGGAMPYSLAVKYNTLTPASSKECKLDIAVDMAQSKVSEGASTEANVTVTNKTQDVLPTPVAIVGLPGGLEPRHDQLKELVKKGTIDAYEVRGREVVLYWRTMDKAAKVQVPLSLIAAVPGNYTGPASRAYLYYTDEHKQWKDGVQVQIAPK